MDRDRVISLLREMDKQQTHTEELGDREIAWYYWRDDIEDALDLPRGALDTGDAE